jgi:hypothetical protein
MSHASGNPHNDEKSKKYFKIIKRNFFKYSANIVVFFKIIFILF